MLRLYLNPDGIRDVDVTVVYKDRVSPRAACDVKLGAMIILTCTGFSP